VPRDLVYIRRERRCDGGGSDVHDIWQVLDRDDVLCDPPTPWVGMGSLVGEKGVMVSSDLKIENSFLQEFSRKCERTGEREVEVGGKNCELRNR
jgi:hypothetical protein